jgi:hypothetical protein
VYHIFLILARQDALAPLQHMSQKPATPNMPFLTQCAQHKTARYHHWLATINQDDRPSKAVGKMEEK